MEIKPSSAGKVPRRAEVTFDSLEERFQFGLYVPFLRSRESWRWVAYVSGGFGLPNYGNKEFPQTSTMPYTTIGHVAAVLAERSFPDTEDGQVGNEIRRTVHEFLQERAQIQPLDTDLAVS